MTLRDVISTWNNAPFNYGSRRIAGLDNKAPLLCVGICPNSPLRLSYRRYGWGPSPRASCVLFTRRGRTHLWWLHDQVKLSSSSFIYSLCFVSFLLLFHRQLDLWAFDWGTRQAREDWPVEAYLVLWIVDLLHVFLLSYFVLSNESLVCCAVVVPLNEWEDCSLLLVYLSEFYF